MAQIKITISGRVQNVGFRYFIKDRAERLGLTGWVRNTNDGRVEALLQGEKKKIEQLVSLCERGPVLAQTAYIDNEPANEPEYEDFAIKKK